jgi:hypothetical protein
MTKDITIATGDTFRVIVSTLPARDAAAFPTMIATVYRPNGSVGYVTAGWELHNVEAHVLRYATGWIDRVEVRAVHCGDRTAIDATHNAVMAPLVLPD